MKETTQENHSQSERKRPDKGPGSQSKCERKTEPTGEMGNVHRWRSAEESQEDERRLRTKKEASGEEIRRMLYLESEANE